MKCSLKLFQTCMNFFLLLNTKEDILKNFGNRELMDPINLKGKKIFQDLSGSNCEKMVE